MKTKFVLLTLLSVMCFSSLSAQVKVGVEGGVNLSHYLSGSTAYDAERVGGMKAGFQLGVTVDYELGKHWVLMSGLSWLQNRSVMKLQDHMVFHFPQSEIKLNNLIVPLKIGYTIKAADKVHIVPSVGLYAAYGFNAGQCDLDIYSHADPNDPSLTETVKWKPMDGYVVNDKTAALLQAFRRWDYGATAGIKTVVNSHYTLGLTYQVGMRKVQRQNSLRNSTWQLSVGYRF